MQYALAALHWLHTPKPTSGQDALRHDAHRATQLCPHPPTGMAKGPQQVLQRRPAARQRRSGGGLPILKIEYNDLIGTGGTWGGGGGRLSKMARQQRRGRGSQRQQPTGMQQQRQSSRLPCCSTTHSRTLRQHIRRISHLSLQQHEQQVLCASKGTAQGAASTNVHLVLLLLYSIGRRVDQAAWCVVCGVGAMDALQLSCGTLLRRLHTTGGCPSSSRRAREPHRHQQLSDKGHIGAPEHDEGALRATQHQAAAVQWVNLDGSRMWSAGGSEQQ